jgi:hypothetical protein
MTPNQRHLVRHWQFYSWIYSMLYTLVIVITNKYMFCGKSTCKLLQYLPGCCHKILCVPYIIDLFNNVTNPYKFWWKTHARCCKGFLQVIFFSRLFIYVFFKMLRIHDWFDVIVCLFNEIIGDFCCKSICRKILLLDLFFIALFLKFVAEICYNSVLFCTPSDH